MNIRQRPINIGPLRAFCAVAEHLNFRMAGDAMALTQSAVSRQVQTLEEELGLALFVRHTRKVELTPAGVQLLQTVRPALVKLDATIRQLRSRSARKAVAMTTWASFASMWLIPKMEEFQQNNPDIDIRIDTSDHYIELAESDIDLALRYGFENTMPEHALRLFGEVVTPVVSPAYLATYPYLKRPADLAKHTLLEDISLTQTKYTWLGWRSWLQRQHCELLEPKRWLQMGYAYQLTQAALSGQGVALARTPLVAEQLAGGQLIEPIKGGRLDSPMVYWLEENPNSKDRPEVQAFVQWLKKQAAVTRRLLTP